MAADRVDLVDEDDARRVLLGLLEHVAHAAGADADEHLDEVGTGDREERHLGLAGDRLGQQGLAGAGRADHQHAARDLAAQLLEARRVAQEFDQFGDFFLGLVATGNVGEVDLGLILVEQLGARLAERHRALAGTAALHLPHHEQPEADDQQHRQEVHEDGAQRDAAGRLLLDHVDALLAQDVDQVAVERRIGLHLVAVLQGVLDLRNAGAAFVSEDHLLHVAVIDLVEELRVGGRGGTRCAVRREALEDHHQHGSHHDPEQQVLRKIVHVFACPSSMLPWNAGPKPTYFICASLPCARA